MFGEESIAYNQTSLRAEAADQEQALTKQKSALHIVRLKNPALLRAMENERFKISPAVRAFLLQIRLPEMNLKTLFLFNSKLSI